MFGRRFAVIMVSALALSPSIAARVQASNVVSNGDFTAYTGGHSGNPSQINNTTTGGYADLTNWTVTLNGAASSDPSTYVFLFNPGFSNGSNNPASYYPGQGDYLGLRGGVTAPPDGQNFVAVDGYNQSSGIQQTLTGLTPGQQYAVTFDWATSQYNTVPAVNYTEGFTVGFGSSTQSTGILSESASTFSGWMAVTMIFTADSTSDVLSFLSVGTPEGGPPVGLLSDVQVNAVPEPSTVMLLGIGVAGYVAVGLRRRAKALAA